MANTAWLADEDRAVMPLPQLAEWAASVIIDAGTRVTESIRGSGEYLKSTTVRLASMAL
jgi:hypothetical protein